MDPRQDELTGQAPPPSAQAAHDPAIPPPYPKDATSTQIERDIRQTRADMNETVDALSERLRPRHLIDDLLDLFKGSGSGSSSGAQDAGQSAKEYGSAALRQLKNHPMPAALIGAGIAWLLFDSASDGGSSRRRGTVGVWRDDQLREHSGSYVDARTGQPYTADYGAEYRGPSSSGSGEGMMDKAKQAASSVGESAKSVGQSAAETASSAAGKASEWAGSAGNAASHYGQQAYESTARGLRQGYEYGRQTFEESLNRYPLAVSAAALAAGLLTGMLLPETRREDQLMGAQSDRLKERAIDKGQDLLDRGEQIAAATADAVTDEAKKQGLTPGTLAEKAQHVAQDTADAARESAKREGLDDLAQKGKAVADRAKQAAGDQSRQEKGKTSR